MKKPLTSFLILLSTVWYSATSLSQDVKITDKTVQDTSLMLRDGTYYGKSRATYIYEPFWGSVRFTLKNGLFTEINFIVRDSNLHETFDGNYEKHFEGNPEYIQQSRNDWKGVQTYPAVLLEKQDTGKVDAISGATWSNKIFRASVKEALKDAR
jgi:major membrane immunogen (membrane-anchored lipoprotein)